MQHPIRKKRQAVKRVLLLALLFSPLLLPAISLADIYRKPIPSLPVTFNPKHYSDAYSVLVSTQIYDRLFEVDEFQNIKPSLAEKWETTEGGRVWTIHLRKDVLFHNGKPLTASDVEFSLYKLLEPDSIKNPELAIIAGAENFTKKRSKAISGIKVLDPNTIQIELTTPFPPFLAILTSPNTEIIPKNYNGESELEFFHNPLGTGPFRLESVTPGQSIVVAANDQYFKGRPPLDKIVFEHATREAAINGFNRGYYHDLEWYFGMDLNRLTTTYMMIKTPLPEVNILGLNCQRPPLNNIHIRKAVAYAIDRKKLMEECFPGRKPAGGYIPPGLGGYSPELIPPTVDLERARTEIKESGLSTADIVKPITILRPDNHPCADRFESLFVEGFKKVGMRVAVKHLPIGDLYKQYYAPRNFDIFNIYLSADHPEALFILNLFRSDHPDNRTGFKSRAFDDILLKASRSEDRYERLNLYRKAQEILMQETPVIPLFYNMYESVYQTNVRGVKRSPYTSYIVPMQTVFFDKSDGHAAIGNRHP